MLKFSRRARDAGPLGWSVFAIALTTACSDGFSGSGEPVYAGVSYDFAGTITIVADDGATEELTFEDTDGCGLMGDMKWSAEPPPKPMGGDERHFFEGSCEGTLWFEFLPPTRCAFHPS